MCGPPVTADGLNALRTASSRSPPFSTFCASPGVEKVSTVLGLPPSASPTSAMPLPIAGLRGAIPLSSTKDATVGVVYNLPAKKRRLAIVFGSL